MSKLPRSRALGRPLTGIVALCLAIFVVDYFAPQGFSIWPLYLAPLVLTSWIRSRRVPALVASLCTGLVILGTFLPPPSSFDPAVFFRRSMGIAVLWLLVMLLVQRSRTEDVVHEWARLLSESQRFAHVGSWRYDPRGPVTWSDEAYRIWGRSRDTFTPSTGNFLELIHTDDRAAMIAWTGDCLAGKAVSELEFRTILPGGDVKTLIGYGQLNTDGDRGFTYITGTIRDVTEEQQAKASLRAFEEQLRRGRSATFEMNFATDRIAWSHGHEAVFGLAPGELESTRDAARRRIHPEDEPGVTAAFAQSIAAWEPFSLQFRVLWPDGGTHWLASQGEITRDESGQPVGTRGVMVDITERMQAELSLRESEARHRSLFDNMLNGFASIRMIFEGDRPVDFVYVAVNRAFETQTGLKDVAGRPVSEVIPGIREADPGLFELYGRVARSGVPESSETWLESLGSWFLLSVYATGQDHIGVVFDVITERKKAELSLRESEERFRQLTENIHEAFWMTDPTKSRMLYISPAYETIWERTCQSLYDAPQSWLETIHPDDRIRIAEAMQTKQVRGDYDETFRIVRPDGTARWVRDRAYPVPDAAGAVVRVVGTTEDVTERHQLEEQYRQAQKMEAIGQLAGGVAHDFNNILMVIQGYGALLMMGDQTPSERAEAAQEIVQASEKAATLVRQLLLFSRRHLIQRKTLDVNDIVRTLVKMLQRILGEDVRLEVDLDPRPLWTHADAGMLDQVLMNLVVNARDAMPAGGRIVISTSEMHLTKAAARKVPGASAGRHACLSVTDTGTGIAPEDVPHIFEPFFTTKEAGKGTGLGLATVFGIVTQHHGFLRVESDVGRGTTFRVMLPSTAASAEAPLEASSLARAAHAGETVLVVEDEPSVRLLVRLVLERGGYQVLEAPTGADALRIHQEHGDAIRLVLTDIVMPGGMNGRQLATQLKARDPKLKILFTSGYSTDTDGRELSLRDGEQFLQKPSSPQHILETVRRCLDA